MTDADGMSMRELREIIVGLLRARRPDRYTVGSSDGDALEIRWLAEIAEEIEPLIPEGAATKALAITLVKQLETQSTRRANKFFRDFKRTGQFPLFWADEMDWPLAIVTEHRESDGTVKRIEERVAIRAATPEDADAFELEERRRAAKDFAARNDTCDGIQETGIQTRIAGLPRLRDWIATVAPHEDPPDEGA